MKRPRPKHFAEKAKAKPQFELDMKVLYLCSDGLYYEAKIIQVEESYRGEPIYTIRFIVSQL